MSECEVTIPSEGDCKQCKRNVVKDSIVDSWCTGCGLQICDACAYEVPIRKSRKRYNDDDDDCCHTCTRMKKSTIRYCGDCRTRDPVFLAYLLGRAQFSSLDEAHKSFYPQIYQKIEHNNQ